MTETLNDLRERVRRLAGEWRDAGRYEPCSDAWMKGFDLEFSKRLSTEGLIGMTWPREFGGGERSNTERLAVTEELLRAGAPVAAHWMGDRQIGPAILRYGNPDLQQEMLPGIVAADFIFCLGMSEPEAGSDLAAVRTRAVSTDGGWRVTGHKMWTSHAHRATHAYLLARTERTERKHHGLTEFILDMSADGVSVSPITDLAGEHHFNEVHFTDVFVPAHRVIGTVGNGWQQVVEQLSFERGGPERVLSTYPALIELLSYAAKNTDQNLAALIGDLVARLAVLRRLCRQIAEALDAGAAPVQQSAVLKYLGNAFERDVVEAMRRNPATQDAGRDTAYGRALLASPGFSIRGGAADVLLSIIARQEVGS